MRNWWLAFLVVGLWSCKNAPTEEVTNRFQEERLQHIYDLQDQRQSARLVPFLKAKKTHHREAAALAFASVQDPSKARFVKESMLTDGDARVRRAAAYALGQLRDSTNVPALFMAFENEIDLQNRKIILEALGKSANNKVVEYLDAFNSTATQLREGHAIAMLRACRKRKVGENYKRNAIRYFDPVSNDQTKIYAAWVLKFLKDDAGYNESDIRMWKSSTQHPEVHRLLDELIIAPEPQIEDENLKTPTTLISQRDQFANDYLFARALSKSTVVEEDDMNTLYRLIGDSVQIVATTAANHFVESIDDTYRQGSSYREEIVSFLTSDDMAKQSVGCYEVVKNPDPFFQKFLAPEMEKLELPRQLETYLDFQKALAKITGETYEKPKYSDNRTIDWECVSTLQDSVYVDIKTNRGVIRIVCLVNEAPGSVSNFLKLVEDGFYDGKVFHRVVPNFVIQAGCPRGDGWGSLDWTQRSEFSNYLRYHTGAVGLASAGNDTEGVQFFITHNSTPFLDGRYSIFAFVTEGMDVVGQIEMGDKIESIQIMGD